MTYSEMAALALENGFDKAKVVDTADIEAAAKLIAEYVLKGGR